MANLFYEFNNNKRVLYCEDLECNLDLYYEIAVKENLPLDLFQIYLNGKYLQLDETPINQKNVDLYLNLSIPLLGGKGGFGSMLRAIGAQIEKTTNKEACRDLSGRRLRDVNAEKRLKNLLKRKADRIKEQEQKKLEKLERLTQGPKIEFKDDEYLEQKDVIPQQVDDAINYILKKKKKKTNKSTVTSSEPSTSKSTNSEPSTSSLTSSSTISVPSTSSSTISGPTTSSSTISGPTTSSSTSSNSDDNELIENKINNLLDNTNNLNDKLDNNSNTDNSNDKSDNKIINLLNKRKVNDEPKIVSKKKKVQLWLGDDDSEDDEE